MKNEAARSPPWAGAVEALLTRMNNKYLMNSTLAPVLKSMNARDASSLQYLISWMGNSNTSWIDTLPMLIEDTLRMNWYTVTKAEFKPRFSIMAVTLAAYVDIVRGIDPLLSGNSDDINKRIFTTTRMDRTWTAVPIDSSLISVGMPNTWIPKTRPRSTKHGTQPCRVAIVY